MAGVLETRYEFGGDVTYISGAALLAGRLVRITGAGASKSKPIVNYTTAATERAVGAVFADVPIDTDVGVSHRHSSWQKLEAAGAIAAGVAVVPAANGRVAAATGAAGEQVYGISTHAAAAAGDKIWVKVN